MNSRRIVGTTDWQEYSVVLDVPERTVGLFFGALIVGTGQIWLDDCTLEIVGPDVASTDRRITPIERTFKAPAQIQRTPWNLDFEGLTVTR